MDLNTIGIFIIHIQSGCHSGTQFYIGIYVGNIEIAQKISGGGTTTV